MLVSLVAVAAVLRVHTYFEPAPSGAKATTTSAEAESALALWREQWSAAGYEPRVLTEADARRHPQYAQLRRRYAALPTVNPRHYELSCFVRYAAMAAQPNGGWMVDYDVMPLRTHEGSTWANALASSGNFTVFQRHVPALLHGDASEWERVAQLLSHVPWQSVPQLFSVNGRPHVSDMHALAYFIGEGAVQSTACGVVAPEQLFTHRVDASGHAIGAGAADAASAAAMASRRRRANNETASWRIVNPQRGGGSALLCRATAGDRACRGAARGGGGAGEAQLPLAVHFSHAAIDTGLQAVQLPVGHKWATLASRSDFIRELMAGWRRHCAAAHPRHAAAAAVLSASSAPPAPDCGEGNGDDSSAESVPLAKALPALLAASELSQNSKHCTADCRDHLGERCKFCGRDGACCRLDGTGGRGVSRSNQTRECDFGRVGCRGFHCCVLSKDAHRVKHFRRV